MRMPLTGEEGGRGSIAQLLLMACQAFERTLATVVFAWGTRLSPLRAAGARVDHSALLHTHRPLKGTGALLIKMLLI